MTDKSLRDYFHELMNKMQGIAVNASSFAYLYGHYPDKIDSTTKEKLLKALENIGLFYDKAFGSLSKISRAIDKSIASKEWPSVQNAIGKELNDIYELLGSIKNMSAKIQEASYKNDILDITKEMNQFQGKCEVVGKIIADFKERLIFFGIYDKMHS